jgi:hypothetical protein
MAEKSKLTEALEEGGFSELAKILDGFGYRNLADLGKTADEVRKKITKATGKDFAKKKPGEIDGAVRVWIVWKEKSAPPPPPSPPANEPVDCELTKRLGDELKGIGVVLTMAGYLKMADLGSTEDEVRKAVSAAVGEKYPRPGDINRVVNVWKEWKVGEAGFEGY